MADSEEKEERKIPAWATRLPFGLCKRYGISLPESATPREAWEALRGRGVSRQEVYSKIREKAKPAGNKGSAADQPKESHVDIVLGNQRMLVEDEKLREHIKKSIKLGTPEMQEATTKLFAGDHFKIEKSKIKDNDAYAVETRTVNLSGHKEGGNTVYSPGHTYYHEMWHAVDYNYGDKSTGETLSTGYKLKNGKTFEQTLNEEISGKGDRKAFAHKLRDQFEVDVANEMGEAEAVMNYQRLRNEVESGKRHWWDKEYNEASTTFSQIYEESDKQSTVRVVQASIPAIGSRL